MIESFLGTITLCILLICVSLSLIQLFSMRIGLKQYEDDVHYIGDYALSLIIFLVISTFALIFYIYLYFSLVVDSPGFNSGIFFLIFGLISGSLIKILYKVIMNIILFFDKSKTTYFLKNHEMNWTILFICLVFFFYFIFTNYLTFALSYLSIILSYFFWIDFSKENLLKKLQEIKSLSVFYWCCVIFVIICGFATIRYPKGINIIAAFIGIVFGFILGILCMYFIRKKSKIKNVTSTNLNE